MVGLYAALKIGVLPDASPSVIGISVSPHVLRSVKADLIRQSEERLREAEELGEQTIRTVEAERTASLRRLLDTLLPEADEQTPANAFGLEAVKG